MANYTIGKMIAETRMERGYSQEELSFGICSTSSMSRIENGEQAPGRKIYEALFQRLGISDSIYNIFVSREEMELYQLIQELAWKLENLDFTGVDELLTCLEKNIRQKDFLERQYLLFAKASLLKKNGGDGREVMRLLLNAIRITMWDFEECWDFRRHLLTFDEITVLNSIALELYAAGEKNKGMRLLYKLKNYLDEHVMDEKEKAKKYPVILNNIAIRLGNDLKKYEEAYEISDQGIRFCVRHNKLATLPYLINNKACAAYEMKRPKEAKLLFHQAMVLFAVCEKHQLANKIRDEIAIRYKIHLKLCSLD